MLAVDLVTLRNIGKEMDPKISVDSGILGENTVISENVVLGIKGSVIKSKSEQRRLQRNKNKKRNHSAISTSGGAFIDIGSDDDDDDGDETGTLQLANAISEQTAQYANTNRIAVNTNRIAILTILLGAVAKGTKRHTRYLKELSQIAGVDDDDDESN